MRLIVCLAPGWYGNETTEPAPLCARVSCIAHVIAHAQRYSSHACRCPLSTNTVYISKLGSEGALISFERSGGRVLTCHTRAWSG